MVVVHSVEIGESVMYRNGCIREIHDLTNGRSRAFMTVYELQSYEWKISDNGQISGTVNWFPRKKNIVGFLRSLHFYFYAHWTCNHMNDSTKVVAWIDWSTGFFCRVKLFFFASFLVVSSFSRFSLCFAELDCNDFVYCVFMLGLAKGNRA